MPSDEELGGILERQNLVSQSGEDDLKEGEEFGTKLSGRKKVKDKTKPPAKKDDGLAAKKAKSSVKGDEGERVRKEFREEEEEKIKQNGRQPKSSPLQVLKKSEQRVDKGDDAKKQERIYTNHIFF
jgi:hypothetical protein